MKLDGQLDFSFYTQQQKIEPLELTLFINSLGKGQYKEIGEVVRETCKSNNIEISQEHIERIQNNVSVWLLDISKKYKEYIKNL